MKLDHAIAQHVEKLPLSLQSEILDFVLYLEQKVERQPSNNIERRKNLASALQKASTMNPYSDLDQIAWVREQRTERHLPGRD